MDIVKLYKKMELNYRDGKHNEFINKFRTYVSIPNMGINKLILFKYIYALVDVDEIEEAMRILNVIFNDQKFLMVDPVCNRKLYLIGRMLYDKSYYDNAKMVFEKYLEICENAEPKYVKSTNNWLKEIERHKKGYFNKVYIKPYLKDESKKIEPGMVVYIKYFTNIENYNSINVYNKPYLIWKVENDKVYTFPVTLANENSVNIFYVNEDTPAVLETDIVSFSIDDIESIYRKINKESLDEILKRQYYRFCNDYEKNIFIQEHEKRFNINIYDIVVLKDEDGNKKDYLITNIDNEKQEYSVREVITENQFYTALNSEEKIITFDQFIYYRISFEMFFKAFNNSIFFNGSDELKLIEGKALIMLIEYNGINYKVMYQQNNNYVCVPEYDESYSQIVEINCYDNIRFIKLLDISEQKLNIKAFIVNDLIRKSVNKQNTRKIK